VITWPLTDLGKTWPGVRAGWISGGTLHPLPGTTWVSGSAIARLPHFR
jgi:hypothetical protein